MLNSSKKFPWLACALAVGAAFAWHHADVRPAAAVAAAMRNPGLALTIATVNHAQPAVTAAVIGYALGLAVTIIAFLRWRKYQLRVPDIIKRG